MSLAEPDLARLDALLLENLETREAKLEQELASVKALKDAFTLVSAHRGYLLERIRLDASVIHLTAEDVQGKSQRRILLLLAERNNGWLVVQHAISAMKEANVFGNDAGASAQVATLLGRSSEFEQVVRGVYRLKAESPVVENVDAIVPVTTVVRRRSDTGTGLTKAVGELRFVHPEWTREQIADELLRSGWDFQGKRPHLAVSAVFAHQARKGKTGPRKRSTRPRSTSGQARLGLGASQ